MTNTQKKTNIFTYQNATKIPSHPSQNCFYPTNKQNPKAINAGEDI